MKRFLCIVVLSFLTALAFAGGKEEDSLLGKAQQTAPTHEHAAPTRITDEGDPGGQLGQPTFPPAMPKVEVSSPQGEMTKAEIRPGGKAVARATASAKVEIHNHRTVIVKNYSKFLARSRATTRPQEGTMPNITINNNIPAGAGTSAKNPNMDGVVKFDPNTFPRGNGDLTVSLGADGSAYMHRDSGGDLGIWSWLLPLVIAGLLIALLARALQRPDPQPHFYDDYHPRRDRERVVIHHVERVVPTPTPATSAEVEPRRPFAGGGHSVGEPLSEPAPVPKSPSGEKKYSAAELKELGVIRPPQPPKEQGKTGGGQAADRPADQPAPRRQRGNQPTTPPPNEEPKK